MIPFALLGCIIDGEEYSMMDCSVDGFTIRRAIFRGTPEDGMPERGVQVPSDRGRKQCEKPHEIRVFGYNEETGTYEQVTLSGAEIVEKGLVDGINEGELSHEYFQVYEIRVESSAYQKLVMDVMGRFTKAIWRERVISDMPDEASSMDRLEVGRAVHAKENTIYPVEIPMEWLRSVDIGLVLHDRHEWEFFLNEDLESFVSWYGQRWGIGDAAVLMGALRERLRMIYIGNEFCHLQFPSKTVLCAILDRLESLGLVPVLVTSHLPIRESQLMEQRLSWLYERAACQGTCYEIVVNDFGTALILQKLNQGHNEVRLKPSLGHLLQKQKRDVRELKEDYLNDVGSGIVGVGAFPVQTALWRHLMIQRIECDMPWLIDRVRSTDLKENGNFSQNDQQIKKERHETGSELIFEMPRSLHVPFFQMNTSTQCVLQAMIQHGSRSAGPACTQGECTEGCLYYGQHFPKEAGEMVGLYNSIFGKAQINFHIQQTEPELCVEKWERDQKRQISKEGSAQWMSALEDVDRLIIGL